MIVFHADLDNTLLYSYKRDIGSAKRCVEIYQSREISFLTEKTYELLQKVKEKTLLVPTTTRIREQYERIDLGLGRLPYALVCNGGVLLKDGKRDEKWYARSRELADECGAELKKAVAILENEPERELEVRFIEEMFVFTKCRNPARAMKALRENLDARRMDVRGNGVKVYAIPKSLDKGKALERFREYHRGQAFAAGDSEFDLGMLEAADKSAAPGWLKEQFALPGTVAGMPGESLYSEEVLEYILQNV